MAAMVKNVLVVDDDPLITSVITTYLNKNGFITRVAETIKAMNQMIRERKPDAVILDAVLPDGDGFDSCREIRQFYDQPIILLTGRTEDIDEVLGLELGADDYIAKPSDPRVILARLKACMRRADAAHKQKTEEWNSVRYGSFSIDHASRRVSLDGRDVDVTDAEFELLWLLASNAGTILSREQIYSDLRGLEYDGVDRSIDMRISRLRRHLGDDTENPKRIKTVRAKGYLFSRTDW